MGRPTQLLSWRRYTKAFTLLEVLVVVAIIGILAALLLPVLSRAKASGKRTACLNNLSQIARGVHMYAGDFNEILFPITNTNSSNRPSANSFYGFYEWTAYDQFMRSYVGLNGAPSPQDKLFSCPADTFFYGNGGTSDLISQGRHLQSNTSYSSYAFNAGNAAFRVPKPSFPGMFPGIMGSKLGSIRDPSKTVLVTEFPALDGYSWHKLPPAGKEYYNDAPGMLSFADGHVSYVKMYRGSNNPSGLTQSPFIFNPPAGYDYQWSGD